MDGWKWTRRVEGEMQLSRWSKTTGCSEGMFEVVMHMHLHLYPAPQIE